MDKAPLTGVRIVSLAQQYPGPYATMLLADLGADVILVEQPGKGDPSRRFTGLFASLNRNKRSVALDLKSPQGHSDFLALVDTADVVLEGFRPGVMDRLNLGADALRKRNPALIFVSISAFGQTGPLATHAGHDLSIQAAAGLLNIPVGKEADATLPKLPLGDIASAMFAALSVVSALRARDQSGQGATVDVSMFDSLVSWMAPFLVPVMNDLPVRPLPPLEPAYGIFATADQKQITLSIAGEDRMWDALCEFLGLSDLVGLTEQEREARTDDIDPQLREAIARHPLDYLCEKFDALRIAFGPVVSAEDLIDHPHMTARQRIVDVQDDDGKIWRHLREPLAFAGPTNPITRGVPGLGEHNAEILGDLAVSPKNQT